MRLLPTLGLAVLALAVAGGAYVRLAPSDPAVWHVDPRTGQAGAGAATAGVETPLIYAAEPDALLERLDGIAMGTARTQLLAGSVAEGRITYITRSALAGFPDYTTVAVEALPDGGTRLYMFARLRFGQSDLGVNAARLEAWRAALGPAVAGATGLDPADPPRNDGA